MKVNKEYIFLAIVIIALSLYLIFKNTDKTHYSMPVMNPIEKSDISKLVISRADTSLTLQRSDERWTIQPAGYPVDSGEIDKMLEAVSNFTLTTLVSESRNYTQYDLTDEKKIGIEAFGGDELLRKFDVGKTASTYRHTFVQLIDDHRVYQVKEDIRRIFDKDMEKLRDKSVVKFDKDGVTAVDVVSGSETLGLIKNLETGDIVPEIAEDTIPAEPKPPWQATDGKAADKKVVERVVNTMTDLKCDNYIYNKAKADFTDPIYTITVKTAEEVTLSIFEKQDDKYPAVSSQNGYPFLLSDWKAKQIMKSPGELLGEKEEKK